MVAKLVFRRSPRVLALLGLLVDLLPVASRMLDESDAALRRPVRSLTMAVRR